MSDNSKIEWTDATWNPITGCSVISPGCTNCYAMKLAGTRLQHHPSRAGLTNDSKAGPVWNGQVRFNQEWLDQPLRWRRPRQIFVCAHGDLFHESVPDEWIDKVFAVMALAPHHVFQVLTKRADRMQRYMKERCGQVVVNRWLPEINRLQANGIHRLPSNQALLGEPLPNVWLGVSVEDQKRADERVPLLLRTPAAVRWLSCEPLLGPIDLTASAPISWDYGNGTLSINAFTGAAVVRVPGVLDAESTTRIARIDWVVAGGESGKDARPAHPDWARSLRDQCQAAGVPFFFKQWGEWAPTRFEADRHRGPGPAELLVVEGHRPARDIDAIAGTKFLVDGKWVLYPVYRAGKKKAGRLLDGREWNEFPDVQDAR